MERHISSYQEIFALPDRFTKPAYHTWSTAHQTPHLPPCLSHTVLDGKNQNTTDLAKPSYLCSSTEEESIQDG